MPRTSTESGGSRRSRYSKATTPVPLSMLHPSHPNHPQNQQNHHLLQHQNPHLPPSNGMRTPVAWALRDANLSRPSSTVPAFANGNYSTMSNSSHQRYPPVSHHHGQARGHRRPSSPSATTTSSDDRDEIPMVRASRRPPSHARGINSDRRSVISRASRAPSHMTMPPPMQLAPQDLVSFPQMMGHHPMMMNGTLRSTKSVPALAMMPPNCPVHGGNGYGHQPIYGPPPGMFPPRNGLRRVGSLVDIRSMHPNGSFTLLNYKTGKNKKLKNLPPHLQLDGPPPQMFQVPPPMMMSNFSPDGIPHLDHFQLQPPPQHFKLMPPSLPSAKMMIRGDHHHDSSRDETVCCKGHLIVLWIILGVVTLGVISGIVLAVTMN